MKRLLQRSVLPILWPILWAILLQLCSVGAAGAAELLVIEQDDCPYCARFNREIAPAYPNTAEGRLAPLRRIDLYADWPAEYANVKPQRFTPTFILVDNGREVDRLVGYPGDEFFWFLLGEMLAKLPD